MYVHNVPQVHYVQHMQCLWYILTIYVHHSTQHVEILLIMLNLRKGCLENLNLFILIHVTQPRTGTGWKALLLENAVVSCIQRGFVDKTRLEWSNFHFYDTANHGGQLISRSGRGSLLGWNRAPVFFTAWWLWQSVPLFFTSLMTQANTGRGFGLFTQLVGWLVSLPQLRANWFPANRPTKSRSGFIPVMRRWSWRKENVLWRNGVVVAE